MLENKILNVGRALLEIETRTRALSTRHVRILPCNRRAVANESNFCEF